MKKILFLIIVAVLIFPIKISAEGLYPAGTLVALPEKGSAVYYIGEDGKKYIFPDSKTYFTWYENFNNVIKIDVAELDKYPDGGIMPYKAGIKLITHSNTANVYAVEPNGVLRRIPSEEVAKNLYGDNWASLVQDVIPGYFASTYSVDGDILIVYPNNSILYPTGTLIKEASNNTIYYVDGKYKRPFAGTDVITTNGFNAADAKIVHNFNAYEYGKTIRGQEDLLLNFSKDKDYKYSDFELVYSLENPAGERLTNTEWTLVRFSTTTPRNIELRKTVVAGSIPSRVEYNGQEAYFLDTFSDSFFESYGDPIKITDFNLPIFFYTRYNTAPTIKPVLKYWVIWDLEQDKQINKLKSNTFY